MPFTNPNAEQGVYNSDGTTILKGCAVVPSGGLTGRAANVAHPSGADVWFVGVAADDIGAGSPGIAYQSAFSNVQVRLASSVSRGDKLRVANAAGEFETAPVGSQNAALIALSNGAAGSSSTWAAPFGMYPNTYSYKSTSPVVGTGLAQSVAHGLGYVPSVVRVSLCELPLPLALTGLLAVSQGAHDAVNLKFTAAANLKFHVEAW